MCILGNSLAVGFKTVGDFVYNLQFHVHGKMQLSEHFRFSPYLVGPWLVVKYVLFGPRL